LQINFEMKCADQQTENIEFKSSFNEINSHMGLKEHIFNFLDNP